MAVQVTDATGATWLYPNATFWTVEPTGTLEVKSRATKGGAVVLVATFAIGQWKNVEAK